MVDQKWPLHYSGHKLTCLCCHKSNHAACCLVICDGWSFHMQQWSTFHLIKRTVDSRDISFPQRIFSVGSKSTSSNANVGCNALKKHVLLRIEGISYRFAAVCTFVQEQFELVSWFHYWESFVICRNGLPLFPHPYGCSLLLFRDWKVNESRLTHLKRLIV